jgi:methylmalonyl-CoA mutase N-terminal domain/subunit
MTINAPASILLALLLAVARRRGIPFDKLGGTVQNDVLKEYVARGTYIYPPGPSMRLVTDVMSYCAREVPQWNAISISGYHIREAGATAVQEIAFALSNGKAYLRASPSFGTHTTTFSKRSPSFARRAIFGRTSRAMSSAAPIRARKRCDSTRRPAVRRSPRKSPRTTWYA